MELAVGLCSKPDLVMKLEPAVLLMQRERASDGLFLVEPRVGVLGGGGDILSINAEPLSSVTLQPC